MHEYKNARLQDCKIAKCKNLKNDNYKIVSSFLEGQQILVRRAPQKLNKS